mgnify:CR=1 FL=1
MRGSSSMHDDPDIAHQPSPGAFDATLSHWVRADRASSFLRDDAPHVHR